MSKLHSAFSPVRGVDRIFYRGNEQNIKTDLLFFEKTHPEKKKKISFLNEVKCYYVICSETLRELGEGGG